jgi:mRNA interferase MazF
LGAIAPKQGELWLADLDPVIGHEQGGTRPFLIVSGDRVNTLPSDLISILPVTTRDRGLAWHYRLQSGTGGLPATSFVLCEQLRTISKDRLLRHLGFVPPQDLDRIMRIVYWMLG